MSHGARWAIAFGVVGLVGLLGWLGLVVAVALYVGVRVVLVSFYEWLNGWPEIDEDTRRRIINYRRFE